MNNTTSSTDSSTGDYMSLWPATPIEITLSEKTIIDLRMIAFQITDSLKQIINNKSERIKNDEHN